MKDSSTRVSRGDFVRSAVVLPALAGLLASTGVASAQTAKGSKAQFKYVDKPNGDKKCAGCTFFLPGKTPTANGACKIVEGDISPSGYCIAYSPKSS